MLMMILKWGSMRRWTLDSSCETEEQVTPVLVIREGGDTRMTWAMMVPNHRTLGGTRGLGQNTQRWPSVQKPSLMHGDCAEVLLAFAAMI